MARSSQANPQSEVYTKKADKKKTAKPVGYRFTNKLAKKLNKKSTTRPTSAELEKYLGKGVYKENRKDKSDINPKDKLAKGGQTKPQSEVYRTSADKKKTAKPVGYRFTDRLAKRLGKNPTTRPTSAEVDKYLGKGVYEEFRKDKTDINPKAKFMGGGKVEKYSVVFWGDEDARELGESNVHGTYHTKDEAIEAAKKLYYKQDFPAVEVIDEDGKDVFSLTSDDEYAKGGTIASIVKKFKPKAIKHDGNSKDGYSVLIKDKNSDFQAWIDVYIDERHKDVSAEWNKYIFHLDDENDVRDKAVMENDDVFLDSMSESINYLSDKGFIRNDDKANWHYTKRDGGDVEYAKGGKTSQTYPQSESYNEFRDIQKDAKPVGYRYTERLAKRLGVSPLARPTAAHIEKYKDKGVYWENRADKSDISRKDKLAMGGVTEHGLKKGDEILITVGDYLYVKNGDSFYRINIELGERDEITESGFNRVSNFAKGGQAASYKETYYGTKWSRSLDKQEKGKPVGYRYTDSLAKRLGVNKYAKPTFAHIEKYLGRGIYFENRKDKSDISPKDKLAAGGQTAPQSDVYTRGADKQKTAKPVGYRFTDKLAKRLGKNPTTRPTSAEVDKYLGKGVYEEFRKDKTDINPKAKLEGGGDTEYAKGGQARISNSEASSYAENHQPFKGNNLEAKTLENGDYVVLSYGYYPIWYWNKKEDKWFQNKDKFSQTTARHISASRPTYDAQVVSRDEMDSMMAKSLEGQGFMALGGELSSFVVSQ